MRILVTNDDGVGAPGIRALARALAAMGEVVVIAPEREQSASGHALTIQRPLRVDLVEPGIYRVNGTPTDCVLLGLSGPFQDQRFDLIVSGVNAGANMGDDVTYSGTVAAAFEGTLLSVPSLAVSLATPEPRDFEPAAEYARRVARAVAARGLPPKTLLNVNVPPLPLEQIRGCRLTRLGHRVYCDTIVPRTDPRGRPYYWVAGTAEWDAQEKTDMRAIQDGYVSVTPLQMDMTDYRLLADMESWDFSP